VGWYDPKVKVEAIPRPVCQKKVRDFVGFTGYYKKFISDYTIRVIVALQFNHKECSQPGAADQRM